MPVEADNAPEAAPVEPEPPRAAWTIRAPRDEYSTLLMKWWRRRESNPRPHGSRWPVGHLEPKNSP